jgi:general secretion pathway protein H
MTHITLTTRLLRARATALTWRTARLRERRGQRGLTLVELMVTVALISMVTAAVVGGSGAVTNARMRGATSMIAGAIRIAYTRASATSRANRLVFDIDGGKVVLEETNDTVLVRADDATGGAAASTSAERDAIADAATIVKGPVAPRAQFRAVKAFGFDDAETEGGRALGKGVRFRKVETGHVPDGQTSGRAYLYFWPGGQTERASIQLVAGDATGPTDGISILVAPLTGRTRTIGGSKSMEPLRDDGTSSEREDRAF